MDRDLNTFADYATALTEPDVEIATDRVWPVVFRRTFDRPGFHLVVLPPQTSSPELRQFMVNLKQMLSARYEREHGERLEYLSLGRFDQQNTTKLHLDGAPELSFLMLGYEPTQVASQLHIADYSLCASALGLTPLGFLDKHNPMFTDGQRLLEPYTLSISDWPEHLSRILLINNSHAAADHPHHSPGVLHGASIPAPNRAFSRIINSTMIAPASYADKNAALAEATFLNTNDISGPINQERYSR